MDAPLATPAATPSPDAPDASGPTVRDRQGRFVPGRSGNPAGKKPGTRSLATKLREHMEPDEERRVMRTIIDAALDGDLRAAIFMMRQLYPATPGREIVLDVPEDADAAALFGEVKAQMIRGEITPVEADRILTVEGRGQRMVAAQVAMARKAAETLQNACKAGDRLEQALRAAGTPSGGEAGPAAPPRPGAGPLPRPDVGPQPLHRAAPSGTAQAGAPQPVPAGATERPAVPAAAIAATGLQTPCKQAA